MLLVIVALSAAACSSKSVSVEEARQFANSLSDIHTMAGQDNQTRLLYAACGEVASCAAGCQQALKTCAQPEMDAAQRSVILADCFADYRKERAAQRTAADTWLRAYIRGYASRAKAKLGPEEQKQLEASMAALQL